MKVVKEGEVDRTSSSSSSRNKKPLWRNMEKVDQLFSALDAIHQNHLGRERLRSIFEFENLVVLVDVAKDIHLCSN